MPTAPMATTATARRQEADGHQPVVRQAGTPVSTEVFRGNTQDPKTFAAQVKKASERFGWERVSFVGDRWIIQSCPIEDLAQAGFHSITALTKPQIHTLIEARLIQMELFAAEVCEVQQDGVRYVLRRHPIRAAQRAASRADKQTSVEQLRQDLNGYLDKHPRAQPATAERAVRAQIAQLKIHAWLQVETEARALKLSVNQAALEEAARLDGCYVIQTELPEDPASKQAVHDRYQDLAQVEQAFRNCKNHAPGNPAHSRANGGTQPRSRPGGDAGLPDSAGTGPRLDFAGRYRRRGTAPIADSVLDGSAGGRRGELPQNPHAARRYGASAPSPRSPPTGSAASHRDDCNVVTRKKLPTR